MRNLYTLLLPVLLFAACKPASQTTATNAGVAAPAPLLPLPSQKQLDWHRMELTAFIHFTTNTFTGLEWGYGNEQPSVFNPAQVDAAQWVQTLKEAGFKGVILTAKHHDGFCLWPSKYTEHSVKNSPWKGGKGDVVKELAEACKAEGLKFGVYLSPWDRNRGDYGQASYVEYYRNQLKELFTSYGPIFEMWFDGANGGDGYYGGANERRRINGATYYDWPTTLNMVRGLQPNVVFFSDAGPDIRWVGNERGVAGETNWSIINPDTLYAGKAGIEGLLNTGSEDGTHWIPAEVDVSIRKGWFYHAEEDSLVKSPQRLFDIYLTSVGRGSNLLLNVPPNKEGRFHPADVASLQGFKKMLDSSFKTNLAKGAKVTASNTRGNSSQFAAAQLTDNNDDTYWATDDAVRSASVELQLTSVQPVQYMMLQEPIALGQRVKAFTVSAMINGQWQQLASATTIGYKRILKLNGVQTDKLRINITDSKACPLLSNLAIY
ncbi:alpha-L-fucosidase [Paracnuella aquatica]|uniref:alpha-L-fucosidase n=1 Tax=Paracnuella aquatica TaxID=2268757 RepID=UPI000DEF7851|nr:alpha-L-fucosidase [Paracnuella aquatica]RPD45562.1 glycoside hydrolase family 29 [Paracnuella aquatica]